MSTLALDLAIKASVVLAVAALVDLVTRRRGSAATRHFVWTMTVLALLVLPLAVAALPAWSVHIPVPAAVRADVADAITRAPFTISRGASAPLAVTAAPAQPASAIAARRSFDPIWFAFALYSAGVAFLLARLVIGQFALRRLIARSEVVVDGDSIELARTCARQLQIRRPVRLLRADDEVMPFTFGTRHAAIVLPSGSARWSTERRTAVILHELAHVARADCLAQRFAALACGRTGIRVRRSRDNGRHGRARVRGSSPRDRARVSRRTGARAGPRHGSRPAARTAPSRRHRRRP